MCVCLCVCMCMHMRVHVHIHVCACMCACVWRQSVKLRQPSTSAQHCIALHVHTFTLVCVYSYYSLITLRCNAAAWESARIQGINLSSKHSIWEQYVQAAATTLLRAVAYSTFTHIQSDEAGELSMPEQHCHHAFCKSPSQQLVHTMYVMHIRDTTCMYK